jgi:hypothetical protein
VNATNVLLLDLEDERSRRTFDCAEIEPSWRGRNDADRHLEKAAQIFTPGDFVNLHVVARKVFGFKANVDEVVGHDDIGTELFRGGKLNRATENRP